MDVLGTMNAEGELPKPQIFWKRIGGHITSLVTFSIGYVIITKVLQMLISPSRHYIEGFVEWGQNDFFETIKTFIKAIWRISWSTGNDHAYVTMWVFSAAFVILFVIGIWKCAFKYKILYSISMCGMFLANYFMMFVAGNTMPERTFLTIPIFAAVVMAMLIEVIPWKRAHMLWGGIVVGLVLVQSANVTDLFWAEDRRQQNDEVMLTKLTSEIAEISGAWIPDIPVVILSDTDYTNYDGTFGFSYFALDNRIYGYLESYGFDYLRGEAEQINYASERVQTMPSFPAEGSVIEENGVIIVNLQSGKE